MAIGKEDSVAETGKITKPEGVTFENLDFVVEDFAKVICVRTVKEF